MLTARYALRRRDFWAGFLVLALGCGAVLEGWRYDIGKLTQLGPGFMPVVLGGVLAGLGLTIAWPALRPAAPAASDASPDDHRLDPRGFCAIVVGVALFLVAGEWLGLAAATFSSVFVSSLGDRSATLSGSLALSATMTVTVVILFGYLLRIPLPVWPW